MMTSSDGFISFYFYFDKNMFVVVSGLSIQYKHTVYVYYRGVNQAATVKSADQAASCLDQDIWHEHNFTKLHGLAT